MDQLVWATEYSHFKKLKEKSYVQNNFSAFPQSVGFNKKNYNVNRILSCSSNLKPTIANLYTWSDLKPYLTWIFRMVQEKALFRASW